MSKPEDVLYVHVPQEGRYVTGVPARDLTRADVDRLGAGRIANAVATGLYRTASKAEKDEAAKDAAHVQPVAEKGPQA